MNTRLLEKPIGHRPHTQRLIKRMVGKLCGLSVDIGYVSPSSTDPRILTSGASLTGVHLLLDRPDPGRGGYHIGGIGVLPNEAMIKSLAESVERYCQLMAMYNLENSLPKKFCTYEQLRDTNEPVIDKKWMQFYTPEQLSREAFIFDGFTIDKPILWIKVKSILANKELWCPAQLLFVGYTYQHELGEPWLNAAVTTGTAAHISYPLALRSALLELIQIDSAMGHWYSKTPAHQIKFDHRVAGLKHLIARYSRSKRLTPTFYWLPNPDLKGFAIACTFTRDADDTAPRVAVGLGADTNLEQAMYKAFLEAYGVVGFSRMVMFKETFLGENTDRNPDPNLMFDLDANVGYYARGYSHHRFAERFTNSPSILASELPNDIEGSPEEQIKKLVQGFKETNKELIYIDLTSIEARELGVMVPRLWSPATLTLSLPGAPHLSHPRYADYGGIAHQDPHPYP